MIDGRVSTDLTYRHADGTRYGDRVATLDPFSVDARAQAFRALRSLGFRETETRRALTGLEVPAHVGEANVVQLIRGPKGTKVSLTLIPADAADSSTRKTITLVRDEIKLENQEQVRKYLITGFEEDVRKESTAATDPFVATIHLTRTEVPPSLHRYPWKSHVDVRQPAPHPPSR